MSAALDVVVVGNGPAAAEAVIALRASGFHGRVDLFSDGDLPPYNPMLGTYYVASRLSRHDCFPFGGSGFYASHGVDAHLATPVVALQPEERSLTTADGARFGYRQCLLATGASTVVPPVPGLEGTGVLVLRSFHDAVRARGAVVAARVRSAGTPRAVVLGASFAGLEVARALHRVGVDVTVVEREAALLPRAAHPAVAEVVGRHLTALGLETRLGADVQAVDRAGGHLVLVLPDARLPADLIVVCTGSRPNLAPLADSELIASGGLDVDARMRTAAPGLLAAGDVARTVDPLTGEPATVALWANARRQGRVAGRTLAGAPASCPPPVPCNVQHVGELLFAAGGSLEAADAVEVEERGEDIVVLGFSGRDLIGFNLLGDVRRAGPLVRALGRAPGDLAIDGRASCAAALAAVREGVTWTTRNAG